MSICHINGEYLTKYHREMLSKKIRALFDIYDLIYLTIIDNRVYYKSRSDITEWTSRSISEGFKKILDGYDVDYISIYDKNN